MRSSKSAFVRIAFTPPGGSTGFFFISKYAIYIYIHTHCKILYVSHALRRGDPPAFFKKKNFYIEEHMRLFNVETLFLPYYVIRYIYRCIILFYTYYIYIFVYIYIYIYIYICIYIHTYMRVHIYIHKTCTKIHTK
jgi:hypothetical protein